MKVINRPKLLIFSDWFAPGYKAGGPIQSCINLAQSLKGSYSIFVLTLDRDFGDKKQYPNIKTSVWQEWKATIQVQYLPSETLSLNKIKAIINQLQPNYIYLNSMFSVHFTIYPLIIVWWKKYTKIKVILAPRGMLHKGAIQYKSPKKKIFLKLLRLTNFLRETHFHATDKQEQNDIITRLGIPFSRVKIISNIPNLKEHIFSYIPKKHKQIKLIFLSRVSPKKNLLYLLERLSDVKASYKVYLSILGPNEDQDYWKQCKQVIHKLPNHIQVDYIGAISHAKVDAYLRSAHLFVLPTCGENFGHAIFEAFAIGRPVLISNQTPWRKLSEKKIGWDIPLDNPKEWVRIIETISNMEQIEFNDLCKSAWHYAKDFMKQSSLKEEYLKLFS